VIDKLTNVTVGAGLLHFALRRSHNIHWQDVKVDKAARTELNSHAPAVLWFTGLSGSGKSTIANIVEAKLHAQGVRTYLLDGDNVRHGLNRDLGFTDADRVENIRRIAEVAALMVDAGLVVLVSFISPFRAERRLAREAVEDGEFIEVFVDTPLEVAEQRDPKGLYAKARRGELTNFTGIDSAYEPPEHPEVRVDTSVMTAEAAAEAVIAAWEHLTLTAARRAGASLEERGRESSGADRAPPGRFDQDHRLALVVHRLAVLVPVGVFAGDRPVVVDESVGGVGHVEHGGVAVDLDPGVVEPVAHHEHRHAGIAARIGGLGAARIAGDRQLSRRGHGAGDQAHLGSAVGAHGGQHPVMPAGDEFVEAGTIDADVARHVAGAWVVLRQLLHRLTS
jgi:adenylyl-sulfate kinase